MKKKVLITGINGFIGSNLKSSLKGNYDVFGLDIVSQNSDTIKCNITNYIDVEKAINKIKPHFIFHLAACLDKDTQSIEKCININVIGTLNIINSAKKNGTEQVITMDTSESYSGEPPYKEDSPLSPKSAYSLSKSQMTLMLKLFISNSTIPITIIRPSIIYGPGQSGKMFIPSMIISLMKNNTYEMTKGEQTRDFVYITDLCTALENVIDNKKAIGEIINIGSEKEKTISEVSKIIQDNINQSLKTKVKVKTSLPYRKNEQMRYFLCIDKAKKLLDWSPKTTLKEGISKTIDYYKKLL